MNIRQARKRDLPGILELNEAALPHVNSVRLTDMEWLLRHAHLFLVTEVKDSLAGFMIVLAPGLDYKSLNYTFFCNNYSDFDYVDRIVISESFRGKRLGTALYQHLFFETSKKLITCEVNLHPPNPNSMSFHHFLGFKEVARQKSESGKKEVSLMVKELSPEFD